MKQLHREGRPPLGWVESVLPLFGLSLVTGALSGCASVGLISLLGWIERSVWPTGSSRHGPVFAAASPLHRVAALVVAGVITTGARLALRRHRAGSNSIVVALWERGGVVSLARTSARSLLAIVDVGLGAALGREGALKQIGGAIASQLARWADFGLGQRRLLFACGTAAGMASAYNVPIGGALFGLEVMLDRIDLEMVTPMILCCAASTSTSRWFLGDMPRYQIPSLYLGGPALLVESLLFGALMGAIAALLLKGLRWFATVEQWSERLAPYMPLIALGSLGIASAWLPELLGNGYATADAALHHRLDLSLLATLPLLRFVATATGKAAKVPGGLFTPMLSIGALLGALVGEGFARAGAVTSPEMFALLGMGALLSGAMRGPLSSVVLVTELGNDYELALPLVFACSVAAMVSRRLESGSLYRLGPRRRPAPPPSCPAIPVHPTREIAQIMRATDLLLEEVTGDPRPLFVVDVRSRLLGVIHLATLRERVAKERFPRLLVVGDLIDPARPTLPVRASVAEARALFAADTALRFVPVLDEAGRLVGEACREDFVS